jgi:cell division protein FtsQ
VFNIKSVEVIGSKHYATSDILRLSNIYIGSNWFKNIGLNFKDIFTFRDSKAEGYILKSRAYIKNVKVNYQISGTVKITIVEREPKIIIPYLGANLILDNEGSILDIVNGSKDDHLPLVKGIKFNNYELGNILESKNPENYAALFKILKIVEDLDRKNNKKLFPLIINIDVSDLEKLSLNIESRILAIMGTKDDLNEYRFTYLREIFFSRTKKEDKGVLNFTNGANPIFTPY